MGLNEADTRAKLIDPALYKRGWTEDQIKREETAGAIDVIGGKPRRRARGRIDYLLRVKINIDTQPVAMALIEAKGEDLPPTHGLEQAKAYAESKRLNVAFVFSTNGHQFVEFDRLTRITSAPRPIAEFPTPDELRARYEAHMGFSLAHPAAKPLLTRYQGGEATRRYYQDAAIRAVFEKIARCQVQGEPPRALLSLATGAGKTFIAVNLLRRIADSGQPIKALFICDRDELRQQASGAFQNVFGSDAAVVSARDPQKNARILIATYQTLDVDNEEATANFLTTHYPENYFTHIIIDECHRSAWGKWSEVLRRNPNAVQVGLTATPRQLVEASASAGPSPEAAADAQISADNIRHFGEPVYEYDIGQGIEDGYLAACEIRQSHINIDGQGLTLADVRAHNPIDAITGRPIPPDQLKALYEKTDFEDRLLLPDRVRAMCADLFAQLVETGGPEQKTIIFCVRDTHADRVAIEMNNLYAAWCKEQGREPVEHYGFKCTAAAGSDYLAELRGGSRDHFVATTVDLLTTGVDVPVVRNIVLFRYVRSPISFYQMIGRGTRLDIATNKLMFRVYDYTNATRLFGEEFKTRLSRRKLAESRADYEFGTDDDEPAEPLPLIEGIAVRVTEAGRLIPTLVNGRTMPVPVEVYKQLLAEKLLAEAPTLDAFRKLWIDAVARDSLLSALPDGGRSALVIRVLEQMENCDLYDVLAELGYGAAPRTRAERAEAFGYKNEDWLAALPEKTAATVKALAGQFARGGTEELENTSIFQTPAVKKAGGLAALAAHDEPATLLRETKERLFAV
ncbi:MAG TPA: DEAD/DEAH box helicase family protein [Roseiflexaceae bacterium]